MMRDAVISFPMFGESFSLNPPASFKLFGITFYFYGAIIALGLILAVIYCISRRHLFGMTEDNILDMLIISVPLGIIGARIYYVVFNFSEFSGDLLSVFNFRAGGLAIYGGVIFAVIGVVIASRWKKFSLGAMLDLGGLGLLIGQAVGRWANFINREAYGAVTDVFCRMGLARPGMDTIYVHPTFLYESLWNILGFIVLHIFTGQRKRKYDGEAFIMYIAWYGFGRMLIEPLRTDSLYLFSTGIRVSQLLAALSCIVALAILIVNRRLKRYDPGNLWVSKVAAIADSSAADARLAEPVGGSEGIVPSSEKSDPSEAEDSKIDIQE